ncbi:unnamed protein product [Effrenium voratum]|nr:unnamed protein product [Effrenium voratum]
MALTEATPIGSHEPGRALVLTGAGAAVQHFWAFGWSTRAGHDPRAGRSPCCTQILGDLGAEVTKVERPGVGDDTRGFAPPFLPAAKEQPMAAYFAAQNRNKTSLTLNYTKPQGQEILRRLLKSSDVLVENFKTGTLGKYGLGYADLKQDFPGLVYCSITGWGQTGPYSARPGYDALVQAMGGFMSVTGDPEGEPMKVGVPVHDLYAGLHGVIGILAALRHAAATGEGQHVDIGMLDVSTAMLANQASNFLATGKVPERLGNQHPNIVPYQVMPAADGYFILSVGNDPTFERFIAVAEKAAPGAATKLLDDDRFNSQTARVANRMKLVTDTCNAITRTADCKISSGLVPWGYSKLDRTGSGRCPGGWKSWRSPAWVARPSRTWRRSSKTATCDRGRWSLKWMWQAMVFLPSWSHHL